MSAAASPSSGESAACGDGCKGCDRCWVPDGTEGPPPERESAESDALRAGSCGNMPNAEPDALVRTLRLKEGWLRNEGLPSIAQAVADAADRIEDLQRRVADSESRCRELEAQLIAERSKSPLEEGW